MRFGQGLGILDLLLWHQRLLEATIHLERTSLIGVFLSFKKSEHQRPIGNFSNSVPWEWQGQGGVEVWGEKKEGRKKERNRVFLAICLVSFRDDWGL